MKTITNKLKFAAVAIAFAAVGTVNAQTTDATSANVTQANAAGEVVRLIDNKGTIKYLQSNNGITTITSTTAGNRTTTTYQLGGTLLEDTEIVTGANEFKITTATGSFVIDGAEFMTQQTAIENGAAAVADAAGADGAIADVGYTLLVRDQATGQVRKMLATDLIDSARVEYPVVLADETANTVTRTLAFATDVNKIMVFRNGAKLRAGTDYTVAGADVTIAPPAAPGPNQGWFLLTNDILEIHYSK